MKELFDETGACAIGDHSAFSFLCGENMAVLSEYFELKSVKTGETLWEEGQTSDYVAIIRSGMIEVKKETEFEGKHVAVGIYKKGSVVGVLGILDGSPRAVTAVSLEDSSLLVITKDNFEKLIEAHPDLGIKLLKGMLLSISMRLRKSFERLSRFF